MAFVENIHKILLVDSLFIGLRNSQFGRSFDPENREKENREKENREKEESIKSSIIETNTKNHFTKREQKFISEVYVYLFWTLKLICVNSGFNLELDYTVEAIGQEFKLEVKNVQDNIKFEDLTKYLVLNVSDIEQLNWNSANKQRFLLVLVNLMALFDYNYSHGISVENKNDIVDYEQSILFRLLLIMFGNEFYKYLNLNIDKSLKEQWIKLSTDLRNLKEDRDIIDFIYLRETNKIKFLDLEPLLFENYKSLLQMDSKQFPLIAHLFGKNIEDEYLDVSPIVPYVLKNKTLEWDEKLHLPIHRNLSDNVFSDETGIADEGYYGILRNVYIDSLGKDSSVDLSKIDDDPRKNSDIILNKDN